MASSFPPKRARPGPWPPTNHNDATTTTNGAMAPSRAKQSGFKVRFSGEPAAGTRDSGHAVVLQSQEHVVQTDLESGRPLSAPSSATAVANGVPEVEKMQPANARSASTKRRDSDVTAPRSARVDPLPRPPGRQDEHEPSPRMRGDDRSSPRSYMKYELRDSPGLVPVVLYGIQHYVSMVGSLILTPLIIVPAMGGNNDDTATVVSTVLLLSGITTLLHTHFGSRLPLIQGPSFVYLAPALTIINSDDFRGQNGASFKHIMKALQGAILISSAFQMVLGYSGLMSILLRLVSPVVVTATVTAVGLSFYSYGFTEVGSCLEIGLPQILLVIIFALYLRKVSVFGHRIFTIYAVPLGLVITWAYAFLLTEAGIYSYKGCNLNIPESNIVSEACRKHVPKMKSCRVDTSHALKASPWFRFPYPFQWGTPVFHWKMALVMCAVSIIASVDSVGFLVGSYHASSLLVASKPPSPGILSRGIGLEGLSSVLASLWGTGTGSSTLTENIHTIAVTRMGSRRSVELGACILIILSMIGKIGGFIASIPLVIVAALTCFMWAMLAALGLSSLRYSDARSSRNIVIVGLSLVLSLSIPAYFQQYGSLPSANHSVPSYFLPYTVASHGPFRTKHDGIQCPVASEKWSSHKSLDVQATFLTTVWCLMQVNYVLNTLLSFHMVIAFLISVVLDNTVPGSSQERGVYVWTRATAARQERDVAKDYELPYRCGGVFGWVKWVGL
ncbi:Nucleobase-ascorbate transporter 12 [Nymphaea thermarum]|nr:Nucleobase-ascorbate transporter 12 [Nymphaea thermarum]